MGRPQGPLAVPVVTAGWTRGEGRHASAIGVLGPPVPDRGDPPTPVHVPAVARRSSGPLPGIEGAVEPPAAMASRVSVMRFGLLARTAFPSRI